MKSISCFLKNSLPIITTLCFLGFVIGSCSSGSTGSGGNGGGNGGGDDNEIGFEPTFTNVQQIFQQSCDGAGCHIGEVESGVRLDGYNNVINSVGDQYQTEVVQPNDPDGSPLVDKIEPDPQIPVRMPEDGPPYLSQDRIDQIRQWIADGALNN